MGHHTGAAAAASLEGREASLSRSPVLEASRREVQQRSIRFGQYAAEAVHDDAGRDDQRLRAKALKERLHRFGHAANSMEGSATRIYRSCRRHAARGEAG